MSDSANVSGERLKSYIDRVERLEEEKKVLAEDIREVMGEAKSVGFDPKIIRKVIRLRKMDRDKRQEEEYLTELYLSAIGEGLPPMEKTAPAASQSIPQAQAEASAPSETNTDSEQAA